jgi:hypothetical protein
MPSTNNNDILKVTARMNSTAGGAVENVFTFKWTGLFSADDSAVMDHVADYLETFYSHLVSHQTNTLTYQDIEAFNHTQDRPVASHNWPTLTAGSSSGGYQPLAVSALTFFRTGLSRILGRKFWGGLINSALNSAVLDSGLITDLALLVIDVLTPNGSLIDGGTLTSGVLDKGGVFREFTDGTVSTIPAYQRRRKQGRGA